jgi:hypothetical protein
MAVTFAILLATSLGGNTFADWRQLIFNTDVDWWRFVFSLITFRHTIVFITLLRFYCLLLLILPLILYALKHRKERLLLTIWLLVQFTVAPHLASIDSRWIPLIRILAWQPVYVLGAIVGYRRCIRDPSLMPRGKLIVSICIGLTGLLFLLRHLFPCATPDEFFGFTGGPGWLVEDRTLGPLRLLDFLVFVIAASYIVSKWAPAIERFPLWRWLAGLGQHSVYIFSASIMTSYLGFLFRYQWAGLGSLGQTAAVMLALLILWATATFHAWLQQSFRPTADDSSRTTTIATIRSIPRKARKGAPWRVVAD